MNAYAAHTATAALAALLLAAPGPTRPDAPDDQSTLKPLLNQGGKELRFDWPMVSIGTGEYAEGPTGVTVFRFARKVTAVADVRGGAPGAANTEFLRLGLDTPFFDAVVLSGGSAYGLESTTAVATALKDDHLRTGVLGDIGFVTGAIVFDLGERRLNEIYPDKRLAQAALRAAQPGVFRTGSAGAGRMVVSGQGLGCPTHSGQGGAFYQRGELKIAAFTVVNPLGLVTDRAGRVQVPCNNPALKGLSTSETLAKALAQSGALAQARPSGNTTISLVVVNQKLSYAELQRLATQVHTSMARGIQPYATAYDGDTLFAVSTNEVEPPKDPKQRNSFVTLIPAIASEVMWDAILTAQPEPPAAPVPVAVSKPLPARYAGQYRFSRFVTVEVTARDGKLFARATGERPAYDIGKEPVELVPVSPAVDRFTLKPMPQEPLVLEFTSGGLVINPGPWAQRGERVP